MQSLAKNHHGFKTKAIRHRRDPHAIEYLKQKASFWVAVLSLFAFVTGNMMGQHGWHVFWKSVLGKYDESLIVYTGTVPPIAALPDYARWSALSGDPSKHTFRQAPKDVLVPLPLYDASALSQSSVYSVGHLGSYATGNEGEGSHVGIDIRVPEGTPVKSIMNGIVVRSENDEGGFGKMIVIKHPRVPDPDDPTTVTTLYSVYAHLSSIFATEGTPVMKDETIGLSGSTGLASGGHLHFQIDRDKATDGTVTPWHPYWPFTTAELKEANLSFSAAIDAGFHKDRGVLYTVNPMLYVQKNEKVLLVSGDPLAKAPSNTASRVQRKSAQVNLRDRRADRQRIRDSRKASLAMRETEASMESPNPSIVVSTSTVVASKPLETSAPGNATNVSILHDGEFSRTWERLTIKLIDASGNALPGSSLQGDLYLRTSYGKAEFRPEMLSALDFNEAGEAVVQMLPRGRSTVVVLVQPLGSMSEPMRYVKE